MALFSIRSSRILSYASIAIAVSAIALLAMLAVFNLLQSSVVTVSIALASVGAISFTVLTLVRRYSRALETIWEIRERIDELEQGLPEEQRLHSFEVLEEYKKRLEELETKTNQMERESSVSTRRVGDIGRSEVERIVDDRLEKKMGTEGLRKGFLEENPGMVGALASAANAYPTGTWPRFLARLGLAAILGISGTMTYSIVMGILTDLIQVLGFSPMLIVGIILAIMGVSGWADEEREHKRIYNKMVLSKLGIH